MIVVFYFLYQVAEVEDVVNDKINKSLRVFAYVAPLEQASIQVDCTVVFRLHWFVLLYSVLHSCSTWCGRE